MDSRSPQLRRVDGALFALAVLATVLILVLQLAEIVARMAGGSVVFSSEATGFLMAVTVFLALPEVTQRREHITADFVVLLLGPRLRRVVEGLIAPFMTAIYVVVLIFILAGLALDSYADGVNSEGVMRLPLVWPQAILVLGLALMLLRLVLQLGEAVREGRP